MHLSQDTVEALQAIGGFLASIGVPLWAVGKVIAKRKATAYAKKWLESQGEAVDDDAPKTPLLSEADLVRSLRAQLDEQEKLHAAEVRVLRRELSEARRETMEERGKNASLTYATAKLRAEYRKSLGLPEFAEDDKPPADNTPGAGGATTTPPPKGR